MRGGQGGETRGRAVAGAVRGSRAATATATATNDVAALSPRSPPGTLPSRCSPHLHLLHPREEAQGAQRVEHRGRPGHARQRERQATGSYDGAVQPAPAGAPEGHALPSLCRRGGSGARGGGRCRTRGDGGGQRSALVTCLHAAAGKWRETCPLQPPTCSGSRMGGARAIRLAASSAI